MEQPLMIECRKRKQFFTFANRRKPVLQLFNDKLIGLTSTLSPRNRMLFL